MKTRPSFQKFCEIAEILRPKSKVKKSEYQPEGELPVVDQGEGLIGGYIDDTPLAFPHELPVIVFGDHTCRFKYVDFAFAAGADGTQIF